MLQNVLKVCVVVRHTWDCQNYKRIVNVDLIPKHLFNHCLKIYCVIIAAMCQLVHILDMALIYQLIKLHRIRNFKCWHKRKKDK